MAICISMCMFVCICGCVYVMNKTPHLNKGKTGIHHPLKESEGKNQSQIALIVQLLFK
jgi:hypothetical protein